MARLGPGELDRGRVLGQSARAEVFAHEDGNTAHDRLRGGLRDRDLRQCRHVHGHRQERVYADRH